MPGARYRTDHIGMARLGRVAPQVVEQVTKEVATDMRRFVPVDTGALRESIREEHDGLKGRVWVGTDHWKYPEYGTRYQRAQPYARPALYRIRVVARVHV